LPWTLVLPLWRCSFKKHGNHDERNLDFQIEDGEDPIGRLGYGIVTFQSVLTGFLQFIVVVALLWLPLELVYQRYSSEGDYGFLGLTLGNLG
jgi:hypothetical protein